MTEEEYYGKDKFKVTPTSKHSHVGEKPLGENEASSVELKGKGEEMVQMERRPNGLFNHPSDFTQEEDENIAKGLMAHLPLYVMAAKMNCCKRTLSNHIKETPWLAELLQQRDENILETAEYQAYRLADAGNPSMIMFILERKGKHRGWGVQDEGEGGDEEGGILMGLIPEEEIEDNAKHVAELHQKDLEERGLEQPSEGDVSVADVERGAQLAEDEANWSEEQREKKRLSAKKEFDENAVNVDGVEVAPPQPHSLEDEFMDGGFGQDDFSFERDMMGQ